MKILLANDDGYRATGLRCLKEALTGIAPLTVVAPDRNRSGASNSLTLDMPLRVKRAADDTWYVINGTPTDCVHLAVTGMLDHLPDMVISGINHGSNHSISVVYSGTMSAAMEGAIEGLGTLKVRVR